jgi:signal transduction histidine kinase
LGFAGVNLKDGELYYSYILEGQDKEWTSPGERNFVSYNLPPGNYTFKVKAVNKDGIESKEAAFFQFSIIPPFWKTTPFVLICTVAIILLFYLIYRYRIAQVIKLEKMRSRISADLHDDLGTGLSRIKFLSETLKLKKHDDPAVEKSIDKISSYSDEMSDKIGEIVWALNSKNDTLADLIAYIRSYAVEYLMNNNISCEANLNFAILLIMLSMEKTGEIFFFL